MKKMGLLLCAVVVLLASGSAYGQTMSKISPDLAPYTSSTQPVQVVVQFAPTATTSCQSLLSVVNCLVQDVLNVGGQVLADLPLVNGVVALVDGTGLVNLSNRPDVIYISKDRTLSPLMSEDAVAVNAPTAWKSGYTGSGISVALIDSGVNSHVDLNTPGLLSLSRIVFNQSYVPGNTKSADAYGHGTHIAGLIAGNGTSSTGSAYSNTFKGIAPNARIVNLRVLDDKGASTDSAVIAAIQRAIALKSTYNIRVMNLSLGRAVFESYRLDPLCQAVEKAWTNGIVVVVAAGNYGRYQPTGGYATISSPGNDPYVITVGAMKTMGTASRSDDLIASYSSKGPTLIDHIVKPDIVAPGNLLVSTETPNTTLYLNEPANVVPYSAYVYGGSSAASTSYFTLSGTSMAAGVVSGMVADLLQAQPRLTPDQVKARLMKTASKTFPKSSTVVDASTGATYTDYYDVFTVGAGYVDLAAALSRTDQPSGSAMSPVANYDWSKGNVYLVRDPSSLWDSSTAWSETAIYGSTQFASSSNVSFGSAALAGSTVMWGATTASGFSTIWSDTVMWGASGDWGSTVMWGATAKRGE